MNFAEILSGDARSEMLPVASSSRVTNARSKKPRDPNKPKRGMSAYLFYTHSAETKAAFKTALPEKWDAVKQQPKPFTELIKFAAARWKTMDGVAKEPYTMLASVAKERYNVEMDEYRHAPSATAPSATAPSVTAASVTDPYETMSVGRDVIDVSSAFHASTGSRNQVVGQTECADDFGRDEDDDTVEVSHWTYGGIEYLVDNENGSVYDADKYENDGAIVEIGGRVPNTPDGKFVAWRPDQIGSKELMVSRATGVYDDVVSSNSSQVSPVPSIVDDIESEIISFRVVAKWPDFRQRAKGGPWFSGKITAISVETRTCSVEYDDGGNSDVVTFAEVLLAPEAPRDVGKSGAFSTRLGGDGGNHRHKNIEDVVASYSSHFATVPIGFPSDVRETNETVVNHDVSQVSSSSKFSEAEIMAVRTILGGKTIVLNRRQLEIAYHIEKGTRKDRAKKASFAMNCKWDAEYFLEIQNQYRQPDGNAYTLQAFQNAIDYWFFKHMGLGNAYARSGFVKTNEKGHKIGLEMPQEFWDDEFLCGFLNSKEGKDELRRGQEIQDLKKTRSCVSKTPDDSVMLAMKEKMMVLENENKALKMAAASRDHEWAWQLC